MPTVNIPQPREGSEGEDYTKETEETHGRISLLDRLLEIPLSKTWQLWHVATDESESTTLVWEEITSAPGIYFLGKRVDGLHEIFVDISYTSVLRRHGVPLKAPVLSADGRVEINDDALFLDNVFKAIGHGDRPGLESCLCSTAPLRLNISIERAILDRDILGSGGRVLDEFILYLVLLGLSLLKDYNSPLAIQLLEKDKGEILQAFQSDGTDLFKAARERYQHRKAEAQIHRLTRRVFIVASGKEDYNQLELDQEYSAIDNLNLLCSHVGVSGSNCSRDFDLEATLSALSKSKAIANEYIDTIDIAALWSQLITSLSIMPDLDLIPRSAMNELGNESVSDPPSNDSDIPRASTHGDVSGEYTEAGIDGLNANEYDEAVADMSRSWSSTTSVGSMFFDSINEHERTYHVYKAGKYLLPNDEKEQSRLDLQHQLWFLTLGVDPELGVNRLYLAPIQELIDKGGNVLDMCTGTGIWAIDFGERHKSAVVLGVDLSPIQPKWVPPNVKFEIDDLDDPWNFTDKFFFVHGRMLFSCFDKPANVIEQAFHALLPGGFLEIQDALPWFRYNETDERSSKGIAMQEWMDMLLKAAWNAKKDWTCPNKYKKYMEDAGFVDIEEVHYSWPINTWPTDKLEREKGLWCLENLKDGLESISMALMTRHLGMPKERVNEILREVEMEIEDQKIHAYIPIIVVYGRKPL